MQVRHLGRQPYAPILERMRRFTDSRDRDTEDELWVLEHDPVFTQGQAGRAEHVRAAGDTPVVASDRGGQVTYHGPGQVVVYCLLDLQRRKLGIRDLVMRLENAMIDTLDGYAIDSFARRDAPGVYIERDFGLGLETRKIGALGLRVRRGCSYHGIALNVAMDLSPFTGIDPCGMAGLRVTQVADLGGPSAVVTVAGHLESALRERLTRAKV
jgi:lipoyl(octanoyl) transferase